MEELEEALATLLGGAESRSRAHAILTRADWPDLERAAPEELRSELGVAPAAARRLSAAFALARAVERARRPPRPCLDSARAVFEASRLELRSAPTEMLLALLVDAKHRLRRRVVVSQGTLTSSLVHPREVFRPAVRDGSAALALCHNHPSGDPEPSPEDIAVTTRLIRAGRLIGIPLLDHVITGAGVYVSLRERMPFG